MQTLYALKQSEVSSYHAAEDFIAEKFSPDLNSMEVQDPVLLEGNRKLATILFREAINGEKITGEESAEISGTVQTALDMLNTQVSKDRKHHGKLMVQNAERIYDAYLQALLLIPEIGRQAEAMAEKNKDKEPGHDDLKIFKNKVINLLIASKALEKETFRRNITWDRQEMNRLYREDVRNDEEVKAYLKNETPGFEDDRQIALHIFKKAFKDKNVATIFEEVDIKWTENRSIVKSMVLKTLKSAEEGKDIVLMEISPNWEEDKEFFQTLFERSVAEDKDLEEILTDKIKNWDIERIAALDKIILKMAICELIHFPSIPVKVTINEYIEISKLYSTPKSKQFINGILDKVAAELTQKGVIKKSGRGLIDNK